MKQTIGFIVMLVWVAMFIIALGEPTQAYETSTPTWVGWAFVTFFLGAPFLSIAMVLSEPKKK